MFLEKRNALFRNVSRLYTKKILDGMLRNEVVEAKEEEKKEEDMRIEKDAK